MSELILWVSELILRGPVGAGGGNGDGDGDGDGDTPWVMCLTGWFKEIPALNLPFCGQTGPCFNPVSWAPGPTW